MSESIMIRSAVTISLVEEAAGGPFVFWHDLVAACASSQKLGFDAIEIFAPSPDYFTQTPVARILGDHNLKLAAVGTGAGWVKHKLTLTSPDAAIRRQARDFVTVMIDVAAEHSAPAIIGSMQGRTVDGVDRPTALRYLEDELNLLGEHAASQKQFLLIEPLNRYETNLLMTLDDGSQLLKRLTTKSVKLLADLFHMNIEEVNVADAIRRAGADIGHVHFVDSNRCAASMGHTDFATIATALREIGYSGFLSAEAFARPDSETAARKTIETFRQYFPRPTMSLNPCH